MYSTKAHTVLKQHQRSIVSRITKRLKGSAKGVHANALHNISVSKPAILLTFFEGKQTRETPTTQ